jgi:hypothetical protein
MDSAFVGEKASCLSECTVEQRLKPSMKFALEKEEKNEINFLDITVAKGHDGLSFEIYRKPTTTDVIIANDSCHPREYKTAAIRYFCNRMKAYKLTPESQRREKDTVQQIMVNNKYENSTLSKFSTEKKRNKKHRKRNGQSLRISRRKRDSSRSCLRTLMSKSRSLPISQLKDALQQKMGQTRVSTKRVVYTS